ncbi:MAG: tetratricopeptide repeat protein [Actinobacteria bacterium]|nr:tetratricopeptide repeat protein [Actinomycetota bacterium]
MGKKADQEKADKLFEEGWELYLSGKLEEAMRLFGRAVETSPRDADVWGRKGRLLTRIARDLKFKSENATEVLNEALECFDRALELSPENGALWGDKGNAILYLGRYEEGCDCHDRATEIDPENSELWLKKGMAYLYSEYKSDALRYFDKAVELDPYNREAWLQKYYIHRSWDELYDAAGCLDMIERIDRMEETRRLGIEPEIKKRRVKGEASKVVFISKEDPTLCLMAKALFNHMAKSSTAEGAVLSPRKEGADPLAVQVMEEIGIELPEDPLIDFFKIPQHGFDCAVSFGYLHITDRSDPGYFREWPLVDLLKDDLESYRAVRDELRSRIEQLLEELGG